MPGFDPRTLAATRRSRLPPPPAGRSANYHLRDRSGVTAPASLVTSGWAPNVPKAEHPEV